MATRAAILASMAVGARDFRTFFKAATGFPPFPFQTRFAEDLPSLVNVPTGLGKTAMAVLGWLWRRNAAGPDLKAATPRRLVYCLPMRVLVEQTRKNAEDWIKSLSLNVDVHVLMGGEVKRDWEMYPERDAILVGTQDMLLSRALNRGYAASRARWPMQFGLLHTDCLWVFDEIQLMGSGLATAAQLEAFRDGRGCRSVWMSATMRPEWLATVDFDATRLGETLDLASEDKRDEVVERRNTAHKPLVKTGARMGEARELAKEIAAAHGKRKGRTLAVVNTVARARDLWHEIDRLRAAKKPALEAGVRLLLLHSRFRSPDRKRHVEALLAEPPREGTICISTQVVEAGVDVDAKTLFTELAPWPSMVQRFGRCNRRGEDDEALVYWIDRGAKEQTAAPYEPSELDRARKLLKSCEKHGVGPSRLPEFEEDFEHSHVIRRKDLVDLFDTTPDLAGNDLDIDRYVRDIEDSGVSVYWREWPQPKGRERPPDDCSAPRREELCSAPLGKEFAEFVRTRAGRVWRWSFAEDTWERADRFRAAPGQVYLIHAEAGGYSTETGWDPGASGPAEPLRDGGAPADSTNNERFSQSSDWQTIGRHSDGVCAQVRAIASGLLPERDVAALVAAARWHDRGKAHEEFVGRLPDGAAPPNGDFWAKAPGRWKRRHGRRHFRHELASALAVLDPRNDLIDEGMRDLVGYLVAAHHGKVRLSIRSLPNETRPDDGRRFARGVWDGDSLPAVDLGGGVTAPAVELSLEPVELGLCEREPFAGTPSWADRMIRLRDSIGIFHLAYLESILRAADWRASAAAERREGARHGA